MKYVLSHYLGDLDWVREYTDDYVVYDRSGSGVPGAIPTDNLGDADYDRLSYLVDNYFDLPDVFLLAKSNLFKYISKEEFDLVKDNQEFTPLLTKNHKVYGDQYGPICWYEGDIYCERNNSWYLGSVPAKYFRNYGEFAKAFHLPNPPYLKFAPGGNYILTRDRVHRYGVDFYDELRSTLPYSRTPGEAHMIERTYHYLWG